MKVDRRKVSAYLLILGMTFLALGIATNNKIFSWVSIAFIVISLIAGGRWMRKRKK